MVKLEIDVMLNNLNKIKTSIQNSFENINSKKTGGSSAVAIGGMVAVLTKLLDSTQSIVGLLEIIGGMINQLVAPFVPILLGLIKPVFILLQKFLFGAMQKLGVSGFGSEEGGISGGEKIIKLILGALAGIMATITAAVAGLSVGWALAIGAALFLMIPYLVDFGKWLGEKLINIGKTIGDWLASGLMYILQAIYDIFGIDLLTPLQNIFNSIVNIFSGLIDIVVGVFTLDWEKIKKGFFQVVDNIVNIFVTIWTTFLEILNKILSAVWNGLKSAWNWLLDTLKRGIIKFANLFIDGLNGLIELLNKIPGVDIGKVSKIKSQPSNTQININIEGNTNDDTIDKMLKALRKEQQKRGTGSF